MKKIGVMGCGTVANYGHIPAILATPGFELCSIYDPNETNLQKTKDKFKIPLAFSDIEKFFQSGFDAVTILSPAPFHLQNVLDATRYKKHILCEKPIAMSESEAQQMIDITQKAGVLFCVGFNERFHASSLIIKEQIEKGAIGKVKSLRVIYIWNCHGKYQIEKDGRRIENRRRADRMLEGGPLVDCGVHKIDLARWWLDSEIVNFQGIGAWVDEYEAPDHIYLHMDHANGVHTMIEMSFSYCHTSLETDERYEIHIIGTEGVILYDRTLGRVELRSSKETWKKSVDSAKAFQTMYATFLTALETHQRNLMPSGFDGLIATRIARQATDMALQNKPQSSKTD
jgi:predicted dehydrogenase